MKQFLVNRRIDLVDSRLKYISMITKSLKDYEYLVNCISTFASTRTRVNEQKRLDMRERERESIWNVHLHPSVMRWAYRDVTDLEAELFPREIRQGQTQVTLS